jgi:hypothetical protein
MAPKDVLTWVSLAGTLAVGLSAHFGVAARVGDAQKDVGNALALLQQHQAAEKELHAAHLSETRELREQHQRDADILRAQETHTRERVIVMEQSQRQILEGLTKVEAVLERSTVVTPVVRNVVQQ